jgi:hypothetical protein
MLNPGRPKFLFAIIMMITACHLYAQEPNPFKSIGKKADVLDISKGKYMEIIEKDSLELIGSVIINRHTRKIEKFIDEASLKKQLADNTRQSRFLSVDPITSKFAELSPYQYASNRPIDGIDLDGLEWANPDEAKNFNFKNYDKFAMKHGLLLNRNRLKEPGMLEKKTNFLQHLWSINFWRRIYRGRFRRIFFHCNWFVDKHRIAHNYLFCKCNSS